MVRRAELARAFVRVLGIHGRGGATIASVAAEAGVAPGLVHHHFASKEELYEAAIDELVSSFRLREKSRGSTLEAWADAALTLDDRSDVTAARAWVGLFAEALTNPHVFAKVRRMLDAEIAHVERRAADSLSTSDASAAVAFVVGSLVLGAFAPRKTAGFAAPALRRLLAALR